MNELSELIEVMKDIRIILWIIGLALCGILGSIIGSKL